GDRVDRLCVLADRVEFAVFAPAGNVGDRLAADVQADRAAYAVGDAVDEDLAALAAVLAVPESVGVRDFVDERADLTVRRPGRDDDLTALSVAPAPWAVRREVADVDGVAELCGVGDQRRDQVAVAVAGDRLLRRRERHGFLAGQDVG